MNGEAAAEWDRLVPELERVGALTSLSRSSLAALCIVTATLIDARRVYEALAADAKPVDRARAQSAVLAASRELRSWGAEYGLTPSSEGRLKLPEPEPDFDDDFD
ncbi:MAG: P27 family phage terminase small subunit [Acidimicrobiia bacterium]